jgi:hypothetical protein
MPTMLFGNHILIEYTWIGHKNNLNQTVEYTVVVVVSGGGVVVVVVVVIVDDDEDLVRVSSHDDFPSQKSCNEIYIYIVAALLFLVKRVYIRRIVFWVCR